jgi:hypothetical protein
MMNERMKDGLIGALAAVYDHEDRILQCLACLKRFLGPVFTVLIGGGHMYLAST